MVDACELLAIDPDTVGRVGRFYGARAQYYLQREEKAALDNDQSLIFKMAAASSQYKAASFLLLIDIEEGKEALQKAAYLFSEAGSYYGAVLSLLVLPGDSRDAKLQKIFEREVHSVDEYAIHAGAEITQKFYRLACKCSSPRMTKTIKAVGKIALHNLREFSSRPFGEFGLPLGTYLDVLGGLSGVENYDDRRATESFLEIIRTYEKSIRYAQIDTYHWEGGFSAVSYLDIESVYLANWLLTSRPDHFHKMTESLSGVARLPLIVAEAIIGNYHRPEPLMNY